MLLSTLKILIRARLIPYNKKLYTIQLMPVENKIQVKIESSSESGIAQIILFSDSTVTALVEAVAACLHRL